MKVSKLPFEQTNQFKAIFLDYISGNEKLNTCYNQFPTVSSFEKQIKEKAFSKVKREVLVKSLENQYSNITHPPLANIQALQNENTFTVVTGHQLNIFSGPLYFIYKIVTTINLAKELAEKYPAYHFVPVYWMATEDHDFEEISFFNLFGKKYQWDRPDAKGAVGKLDLKGLESIIEEMDELPECFKTAYLEKGNLTEATRYYVNELFGKDGLVIIDGDDAALKTEFREVLYDDLFNHSAQQKVMETNEKLLEMGYKPQIHPREINLFYHKDGIRERIEKEGEVFKVLNTDIQFSGKEAETLLDTHPEYFSPNVVLRPVYQETILPNLAYIGGPSELAYWLQLKGVFDHFQTVFPMLVPRNFALFINRANCKKFSKLGIDCKQIFEDENTLKNNFVQTNAEQNLELDEEIAALEKVFEGILSKAVAVDKSLEGFIGAETKKVVKQIENIRKRIKKAEENKQSQSVNQLLNLKKKLFPNGSPQERTDNFLNFYLNDPHFIDYLKTHFDALDFQFIVLEDE